MFELTNYKIVWLLCDIEYSITTYILMIAVYLCIHSVPQSEMKISKIIVIYPLNTLTNRSIDWKEPRHVLCCDTVAAATAAPYNNIPIPIHLITELYLPNSTQIDQLNIPLFVVYV